jgi:TPP-dependent pyruvate/acetoin dehydrogenase alpha subunit
MTVIDSRITAASGPSSEALLEIYKKVMLIYLCDERLRAVMKSGKMVANYYSPRGQEVVAAALAVSLREDDYYVTIYRGLHDHLAKGVPLKDLWAEYWGKAAGSCGGKGGPMHITHPETGVMVTTGIVGSGMPIANGLAWASQLRGDGRVTVTSFGDGATNIGACHEALNMASLWKLPVVFLCQNNGYAEHTKSENCTAGDIAERARAYAMASVAVDGNDPVAMWQVSRDAIDRARRGEGPTFIEAKTFRFQGHNFGDPSDYIPKDEFAAAVAADPVPAFRQRLIDDGIATAEALDAIEAGIAAEIEEAVAFADAAPYPDIATMRFDTYAQEIAL